MTLNQALALSTNGLDARTDHLRDIAATRPGPLRRGRIRCAGAETDFPHAGNRRELQACRALLNRLIDMLA